MPTARRHFLQDCINLGFEATLPLILQTEATECGLACLGMIAGYHQHRTTLAELRARFPVSLKGVTLATLIKVAKAMDLGTRCVKLELDHLSALRLPCILHWNFNHFIVLKAVTKQGVTIHDPAVGLRKLTLAQVSAAFTGVAMELWPNPAFRPQAPTPPIRLRSLLGRVSGLTSAMGQILMLALSLEVIALVSPFFLQWVIDNVIVATDRDLLTTLALGFGLLLLVQQCVTALRSWVIVYFGTTLNLQWRANVFGHLLRLPASYFAKRHLGDVVSRFGAIDLIQRTLTTSFLEAVIDGLMTIVTLIMMFMYSPTLAWIAIGTMTLYALTRWGWYRPLRSATEEQIVHAATQQSHFLETVRGIRTIKLFQRQEERRSGWLSLLADQINAEVRTQKLQIFYKIINGLLFGIENILIIWLAARLVLDNTFSVGIMMAFIAYKGQFDSRVSNLIDKYVELQMLQLQGERLADIVLTRGEVSASEPAPLALANNAPMISMRNLRFRYAEYDPYVLDGVTLQIAQGESVAIVGPSGCGKSTLMNLLLGMMPVEEGEVHIGGMDLRHADLESLRELIGTVLQDDVLFSGSIADNISFFDPQADRDWVQHCAHIAAVAPEILAMPMGFNTLVGDMGTVLSGGQKQRVLLARALYKRPKILFLDEATSHLDLLKEQQVNDAIKSLHITRLIIAHRPETIASADRIIIISAGKAVEKMTASSPRIQDMA